jgi:hypothetical protein
MRPWLTKVGRHEALVDGDVVHQPGSGTKNDGLETAQGQEMGLSRSVGPYARVKRAAVQWRWRGVVGGWGGGRWPPRPTPAVQSLKPALAHAR